MWLLILTAAGQVAVAQISPAKQAIDTAETPSPAGPDRFDLDTLNKPEDDSIFIIRGIYIDYLEGKKRTRRVIITRELPFAEGDTINSKDIPALFARAKAQVLGLALFSTSDRDFSIAVDRYDGDYIDIRIAVKERWDILVLPHLKPVDRSLSEWLFQNRAQISRLDYGVKLTYNNATGSNDRLRFQLITGYTRQLVFSYHRPYIDKDQKWGMNVGFSIGKTHEVNAGTHPDSNTIIFIKDRERYLRNFSKTYLEVTHRPELYTTHTFGVGYQTLRVGDTVLKRNPYFFKQGQQEIKYPEIYYRLTYQKFNLRQYPTRGYAADILALKQGLNNNMNVWQLTAKGVGYWPTSLPLTFYSIAALGTVKFPLKQSFYSSQLLGYADMNMSGYEQYVIDGTAGGLIKATIFRQIANFSINPPIFKKWLATLIPLKIYGKVFGNAGYAHNPQPWASQLNNRMLYGAGFGFDIFTDYDFTLRLEFSLNHKGENRFFTEKKTIF